VVQKHRNQVTSTTIKSDFGVKGGT